MTVWCVFQDMGDGPYLVGIYRTKEAAGKAASPGGLVYTSVEPWEVK